MRHVVDGVPDRAEEVHVLGANRGSARTAADLPRWAVRDAAAVLDMSSSLRLDADDTPMARRGELATYAAGTDAPRPGSPDGAQEHAEGVGQREAATGWASLAMSSSRRS